MKIKEMPKVYITPLKKTLKVNVKKLKGELR